MSKVDQQFDVRTLAHKLRRKEITQPQVNAFLAELPDLAAKAVECETRYNTTYEQRQATRADDGDDAADAG